LSGFDPYAPEVLRDPYPAYEWLREHSHIHHLPNTDIWAVSRFFDVEFVLRNHTVFSSTGGIGPEWQPRPMMSMYDPPEHTRLRRIVARHFTPKYLTSLTPRMKVAVDAGVDALLSAGGGDIVGDFAEPLVAHVMADILGVPDERRADFRRWSYGIVHALAKRLDGSADSESERTRAEFVAYLKDTIAAQGKRAVATPTDIIQMLVAAGDAETLTSREITAFCVLLLVAGFETTVNGLANTSNIVMREPGVWRRVREDRSLAGAMIEEALRFDSPDQAFFRNTLSSVDVGGITIPERQKVMVLFGSANRDPRKYVRPDEFCLERNPTDHVAFGAGVHYCIGAPLARVLYKLVWDSLLERASVFEPSSDGVRTENLIVRGFRRLPVRIQAA
jgi:cytochrome P450